MLDLQRLGDFIDAHYQRPGDQLFRMERFPQYEGDAAQTTRWQAGAAEPDWSTKQGWLDVLADDHRRGLISRRVRIFTADLTDNERASCEFGYQYNGRYEDIRVLHAGEHPTVTVLDHDYWIIENGAGGRHVVRMNYTPDGDFTSAHVLDAADHGPYLRERDLAWPVAEPFTTWWGRHTELHRRKAA